MATFLLTLKTGTLLTVLTRSSAVLDSTPSLHLSFGHDNQRVTQALNDGLQSALLGRKAPDVALNEAQATATRLLRPFQR